MTASRSIRVFWAENDSPWPSERERAAAALLPQHVAVRALRYRHWQDRQGRLIARLLLIAALRDAGLPTSLDALTWNEFGRPCLPVPGAFSIAHSGGRVLCAWADRGGVGVDVEQVRPVQPGDYVDLLSADEKAGIAGAADPSQAFLRLWTVKEAVAKAAGLGLMGEALPESATTGLIRFAGRDWRVACRAAYGYLIALAADLEDPEKAEWKQIEWQSLRLGSSGSD